MYALRHIRVFMRMSLPTRADKKQSYAGIATARYFDLDWGTEK